MQINQFKDLVVCFSYEVALPQKSDFHPHESPANYHAQIAELLRRLKSTISRELARNSDGAIRYHPKNAYRLALKSSESSCNAYTLAPLSRVREQVTELIKLNFNGLLRYKMCVGNSGNTIETVTDEEITIIYNKFNNQPRK